MIDLGIIDSRFLAIKWKEHPITSFWYQDLEFSVRSNANLKTMKIVVDNTGMLEIRINPNNTWAMIKDTVFSYYSWCVEQHEKIISQFDTVSYLAQKNHTFDNNDLIYIWGMPYLLEVEDDCEQDDMQVIRPRQVVPVLLPKGCSRFATKFAYLLRQGYISTKALDNLPIFNQGRMIMPKHSLYLKSDFFDRDQITKVAQVTNTFEDFVPSSKHSEQEQQFLRKTLKHKGVAQQNPDNELFKPKDSVLHDPVNNFYLEQFARLLQTCQDSVYTNNFFSSRMLSDPKRIIAEAIIKPFVDLHSDIDSTVLHAETTISPCYKSILKNSIAQHTDVYAQEPFWSFDLKDISKFDSLPFDYSLYHNFISPVGIRPEVLPARMVMEGSFEHQRFLQDAQKLIDQGQKPPYLVVFPERKNYLLMGRTLLDQELERHLKFYQTGVYSEDDKFKLSEQELTLFSSDLEEIDPSLALMGYLPDVPQAANNIYNLSQSMVDLQSKDTLRPTLAANFLGKKQKRESTEFFARNLFKPGVLRFKLKGKRSRVKVQLMLENYLEQELSLVACNLVDKLKERYVSCYLEARECYNLDAAAWVNKIEIKKMKPLGQCYRHGPDATIKINLQLIHYPLNVLISVIIHELCHLVKCNHSEGFKYMLNLFCPNAELVSNSIINLGIVPIKNKKPPMARLHKDEDDEIADEDLLSL